MESAEDIRNVLACCTGSENCWKIFPNDNVPKITDGVKAMAEMCGAFWLVIAVVSWQSNRKVSKEPFQVWKLVLDTDKDSDSAVLIGEDGNDREIARQEIEYTDFPLPEGITLYFTDGILLLPSEY
ncbi:MAG: hypothetical protein LBD41_02575 [Clostridiales Family XIII bacterium]|jgi:hypothetical protein|nr:hypothetical protein [Clostridiales Family XIII bacterium]